MAKKKFYYNNKNKNKKPQASNNKSLIDEIVRFTYSQDQLETKVEELGLSETTEALLLNNKVRNAFDLVRRTPKDMYKIQGLNKKIYLEILNALQTRDMKFSEPIVEKQETPVNEETKVEKKKPQEKAEKVEPQKKDKVNPKKDTNKPQKKEDNKKGKDNKPVRKEQKLTQPLPVEEWRKVTKNGLWGFSDGLKVRIAPQYDEVFNFREGLASVELNEKCGYIDSENNIVIPFDYETAFSFQEGYAAVSKDGKYGYINKENEVIIDFKYDAATAFENGEAKIKQDGKWGTILPNGEIKWI